MELFKLNENEYINVNNIKFIYKCKITSETYFNEYTQLYEVRPVLDGRIVYRIEVYQPDNKSLTRDIRIYDITEEQYNKNCASQS